MSTLYFGGDILTMTGEESYVQALVVDEGRIVFAGDLNTAEEKAGEDAEKIDLKGKTLMPSFIDGHGHVSMAAQMVQMADLSSCESFDEIVATLKEYMETHDVGEDSVIIGFGYDHNFLKEQAHPGKAVLDRVSTTVPVYISHVSGHMGCVNSATLALAGITEDTPNPQGGVIGRVPGTNEPDGYLEEAGMMGIQGVIGGRVKMDIVKAMKDVQALYLKYGVTTVQDGASTKETIGLMKNMCESGIFNLDVVSYPLMGQDDPEKFFEMYPECDEKYSKHFKLGGYKAVLDGSPQGKSAWLTKPYENSGDYCAYSWFKDEVVEGFMKQAVENDRQILVHCNGDAAGDQFLNAYEAALNSVEGSRNKDLRPVMIHCQTARDDQLDRMVEMGMLPSIFVGHVYYWGDIHLVNLGKERGERVSPCKSAVDRGLKMNFHQDTPVTKPDMLHSVWCAVNRKTRFGKTLGAKQCVSVYEALKAVTINAAYAYHEEDIKGTLEEGKYADLVVLDANPMKTEKEALKDIKVVMTVKEGKMLYQCE